jgi:hypothetical protein
MEEGGRSHFTVEVDDLNHRILNLRDTVTSLFEAVVKRRTEATTALQLLQVHMYCPPLLFSTLGTARFDSGLTLEHVITTVSCSFLNEKYNSIFFICCLLEDIF